jgi:broad specificity phosphatase PhoE
MLLTRHGQTIYNRAGIMQGTFDSPLTQVGIAQAEAVGENLRRHHPQLVSLKIVTSPLPRAYQTAAIIAEVIGLDPVDIQLDDAIVEVSWGDWNGMTRQQIAARDPDLWQARENSKWSVRPPQGESYQDLAGRLAMWLAEHQDQEQLLVVAHGVVTRVLRGLYQQFPNAVTLTLEEPQGVYFKFAGGKVTRHPEE